jgi:hypoxanthine-DNA glycosylase
MSEARSFPPIATPAAHTLILGSMPGRVSLAAAQYYAHQRNTFWPIMGQLLDFDPALPYAQRVAALEKAGIAVWDVLASCVRPGSLDANIAPESIRINDFARFFAEHPDIRRVFFNGSMAESCFRKHVEKTLDRSPFTCQRLPSSSPAHAALSLAGKQEAWRVVAITWQKCSA